MRIEALTVKTGGSYGIGLILGTKRRLSLTGLLLVERPDYGVRLCLSLTGLALVKRPDYGVRLCLSLTGLASGGTSRLRSEAMPVPDRYSLGGAA